MSARERFSVSIRNLRLPASYDAGTFEERLEREIADRRFGPGPDGIVTTIADRIADAVDESRP